MNKLKLLCQISFAYYKQHGFGELFKKVLNYIRSPRSITKTDIAKHYSFISRDDFGYEWTEGLAAENTINWVIPNFNIGSGGHLNIFRFISFLESSGYVVNIVIDEPNCGQDTDKLKKVICDNFVNLEANVFFGIENAPVAFSTFATSWTTAYTVKSYRTTKRKFYFVQDFEPLFYPLSSEYAFAENTYKFGFTGITAGKWLSDKLSSEYAMECDYVGFSYDKDRYSALKVNDKKANKKRIFFYARPPTPRRALELGILALQNVCKQRNDVEVVFAGWDLSAYSFDFDYESHGVVSLDELPELYRSCDMGLVLSFTNLSLLPLELMASGVPVVSNTGKNVEWLLNKDICQFAESDVNSITRALLQLIDEENYLEDLKTKGISFAEKTSWKDEGQKFVNIYDTFLKGK
ncbi:glycosyltransferase [Vibrio kanaloae]|uniref:rhamnosyltransferase WsaF family glycosyltransferase n=1 Tax=Vibrio kanaloae TaxID=170673 RepID=UPI0011B43497|nr:glycosyltransferase [Vibrio kanaloae]NOI03337.1 glycosyltransferase [Vibrio kanaloae]